MKNQITLIPCFFIFALSNAQPISHEDYTKGYILKKTGEREEVQLKYMGGTAIKVKTADGRHKYSASELNGYEVNNDEYIVLNNIKFATGDSWFASKKESVFAKQEIEGDINLYTNIFSKNSNGVMLYTKVYMLEKRDSPVSALKQNKQKMREAVKVLIADKPEIYSSVDWKKFKHKDIPALIRRYNQSQ